MINWGDFPSEFSITHFNFATINSILELLYPKLIRYFTSLSYGFTRNFDSSTEISNDSRVLLTEAMEERQDFIEFAGKENDGVDEEEEEEEEEDEYESPEFSFTFKFPSFEEFSKTQKDFSKLLDFDEHIGSFEVSLEDSEVHMNSIGGSVRVSHDDQRGDEFEHQECDLDQMMVDSLNLKNIVQKEENLQKTNDDSVCSSSHSKKDSIGSNDLHSIDTFSEDKLQEVHDESVHSSPGSDMYSIGSHDLHSPTFELHIEDDFMSDEDIVIEFNVANENEQNDSTQVKSENDFRATKKLESLWEHEELIEQLKMEIKKAKATGLPTIYEESESPPKILEDLKPLKIEEVYQNRGRKMRGKMSDVHKFYKSYRERMCKFDVFSYQKLYAIGLLQLKDPLESSSSSTSSIPESATLLTQSFTTNKGKKYENDPTLKLIQELESDLEIVYVGQMCLSWEILHWQYGKALDIWESDPRGLRRFNDIAGEFQQFQVLMQRFIEDEPFQGPRVQNYAKTRCVFRNLLQVPMIRDDHLKDKNARREVVCDITSDALVEILEESIRLFWRFVRADKYKRQTPVEFQRPVDLELFMDLQDDLHKKERKLKEHLRSKNSILKKLRSCKEDETEDHVLYFFCQVDMKLVSRVLQMSKLTSDQLIWCHNKLSRVSFMNHKIHVEPSFLLFPC